jgi:hypothetical protein
MKLEFRGHLLGRVRDFNSIDPNAHCSGSPQFLREILGWNRQCGHARSIGNSLGSFDFLTEELFRNEFDGRGR